MLKAHVQESSTSTWSKAEGIDDEMTGRGTRQRGRLEPNGLGHGIQGRPVLNHPLSQHPEQNLVASLFSRLGKPIRTQSGGGLRNTRKQRGFSKSELGCRLAEIPDRRRLYALQVATVRGEVKVGPQDFVLGEGMVRLPSAGGLRKLHPKGSRTRVEHAAKLHIQGACSGDHPTRKNILQGGSSHG